MARHRAIPKNSYWPRCLTQQSPQNNNVVIRIGEARLVGWSRHMLYSGFNILPRSVITSTCLNGRSDNLDVVMLKSIESVNLRIIFDGN